MRVTILPILVVKHPVLHANFVLEALGAHTRGRGYVTFVRNIAATTGENSWLQKVDCTMTKGLFRDHWTSLLGYFKVCSTKIIVIGE